MRYLIRRMIHGDRYPRVRALVAFVSPSTGTGTPSEDELALLESSSGYNFRVAAFVASLLHWQWTSEPPAEHGWSDQCICLPIVIGNAIHIKFQVCGVASIRSVGPTAKCLRMSNDLSSVHFASNKLRLYPFLQDREVVTLLVWL